MNYKTNFIVVQVIKNLYIVMFLYAASSKLRNIPLSMHQMRQQPFPDSWAPFLTIAIPVLEILLVLILIIPKTTEKALYLSTITMAFFTGYVLLVQLKYFGKVPCSCGGVISGFSWKQHLLFNFSFLLLGILGIYFYPKYRSILNIDRTEKSVNKIQ